MPVSAVTPTTTGRGETGGDAAILFAGTGEVRSIARELDWSNTPLGPTTNWSPAIRTMVRSMFDSPFPICLWSGPQYALIYNDAYRRILVAKHPAALGQPGSVVWAEIWDELRPQFDGVRTNGDTVYFEDAPFVMARLDGGGTETAWFNYSLSPLRDEDGSIAAVLNITPETSSRVLLQRRLDEEQAALAKSEELLRLQVNVARADAERVQLALGAGAIIGTWFWDLPTDRFTVDEAFATAFGLDPALGREGIPLAQIVATVHPDDQAGLASAIDEAIKRGGAYAHQYRTRRLDGNYYWLEANGRVDHAPDGTPTRFPGVLIDVEERRAVAAERDRVTNELRESEQFLRSVLSSSNDCIKVLDLDANLTFMSEGGQRIMEVSDFNVIAGCPWPDFWQDEGHDAAKAAISSAKAGVPSTFQGYAETMKGNRRYWDVQVSPIFDPDGKPERILSVSRDITALKEAEEMRTVLAQEVAHRMKNTLAMVQAIVTQTLRQSPSMEAARMAISQRLLALARAQDILTHSSFAEADAYGVVMAAIGPHQTVDSRIHVNGQRCLLTAQQALGLSLAIHELATNAAKYGALSNATGTVDVAWTASEEAFEFTWIETGGPLVTPPNSRGFGSKLIERIVASYFDGEGVIDFNPAGIRFRLTGAFDHSELAA